LKDESAFIVGGYESPNPIYGALGGGGEVFRRMKLSSSFSSSAWSSVDYVLYV